MSNPRDPQPKNPSVPAQEFDPSPTKYAGKPLPAFITENFISMHEQATKYKGRDVYVFNNSKAMVGAAMRYVIPIITGDQSEVMVELPITWLPQNLSQYAHLDDIYRSSNLRTALARETLKVVNPDFAEAMLNTPAGMQESARLAKLQSSSLSEYGDLLEGKDKPTERHEPAKPEVPADLKEVEGIRPELVVAVKSANISALVSLLTLAQVNEDLSDAEAKFVRSKISDRTVLETLSHTPVRHVTQAN
jgi:hypothetical protein